MTTHDVAWLARHVLHELADLGAYVRNSSVTTTSVYIKFEDERIGSLRIGDHPGKAKYAYRWNLEKGRSGELVDRGIRRYYYDWHEVNQMIHDIRLYAERRKGMPRAYRRPTSA